MSKATGEALKGGRKRRSEGKQSEKKSGNRELKSLQNLAANANPLTMRSNSSNTLFISSLLHLCLPLFFSRRAQESSTHDKGGPCRGGKTKPTRSRCSKKKKKTCTDISTHTHLEYSFYPRIEIRTTPLLHTQTDVKKKKKS